MNASETRINMLPRWETDYELITKNIEDRKGFLKIVLKTLDEHHFLQEWIDHHAKIVGIENLIIADNGSTDERVIEIYKKYSGDLVVFSFSGLPDRIHNAHLYKHLYESISRSSSFRLFIDTDERLVWFDEKQWINSDEIVYRIKSVSQKPLMPTGLWPNAIGSDTVFNFLPERRVFLWGKPIVSSGSDGLAQMGNKIRLHNCQFGHSSFPESIFANLNILHLMNLNKDQRLKSNKNKLVSFGLVNKDESYETIASKNLEGIFHPDQLRFIYEMRNLLAWNGLPTDYEKMPEGAVRLCADGTFQFTGAREETAFTNIILNSDVLIREILELPVK